MTTESKAGAPRPDSSARRTDTLYFAAITLVLLLGAFLRLNRFLFNRSLWLDEARLALNIIERSPLQLASPLSYGQAAPIGFTVLVKVLTMAAGIREPVLRLLPLIFGLVSLPLFYLVAARWLPRWATLVAVTLFATSDSLGDYSAQFKQYSSDVAVTLVLVLTAIWFTGTRHRARYAVLAGAGAVAVWLSHPASIVLAGVGVCLLLEAAGRRASAEAAKVGLVAAAWLLSFAVTFALSIRTDLRTPALLSYWTSHEGFLALPPTRLPQIEKALQILVRPFEDPTGFALYSGVVLLFILGAVDAFHKGGTRMFLVAPLVVAVGLSALKLYPFSGRLLLFAVPLIQLLVVTGLASLHEFPSLAGRGGRLVTLGVLGLLLFQPLRDGLARGLKPRELEETRPVMTRLVEGYRPQDVLAAYYASTHPIQYYSYLLGFDHGIDAVIKQHAETPDDYCGEVEQLPRSPRVWIVFSHTYNGPKGNEEKVIVDCLDGLGRQESRFQATGASLYLYDLSGGPEVLVPSDEAW